LHALMTNLGGHDLEYLIDTFDAVHDETPRCFIAYTIKGYGLPIAGHKDNHAGLMTPEQMATFRSANNVPEGAEWEPFAGLGIDADILEAFLGDVPYRSKPARSVRSPLIRRPPALAPKAARSSTQGAFGDILKELSDSKDILADHIVTASPDVAVSTNLGAWINQRAIYHRHAQSDIFHQENVLSPLKWTMRPGGQHIELGIAEHNLFLLLGVLGLSEDLFGVRLLPIGTVYDPFVNRGLDALIYACYQNARFMVAGTPSGISLATEGGAHQSINTPLIGISIPGLTAFEPAFADELTVLVRWGLEHMQRQTGGAVYLRLSTRPLDQPKRALTDAMANDITAGGYWREAPAGDARIVIVYAGAVAPEAAEAHANLLKDFPGAGLLAVTSADRLHQDWLQQGAASHTAHLLGQVPPAAKLITVIDGHPLSLSWLGGVAGHRTHALGTTAFGQSASLDDLYRAQGIDAASIEAAAKII